MADGRADLQQVQDLLVALTRAANVLLREQQALTEAVQNPPAVERLTTAIRGLRDDLAESHERLRREAPDLAPLVEAVQGLGREVEALRSLPPPPAPPMPEPVDLRPVTQSVERLAREVESLRSVPPPPVPEPVRNDEVLAELRQLAGRIAGIEQRLDDLARQDDVRRGVDRVVGEVKAVDLRIGALAEDVRIVRTLRDGLQALQDGVDGVRQLTARAATSQQMADIQRELGAVLGEIAAARNQVLRFEQTQAPVAAEVVAVTHEVDDLSERIERLAEAVEARGAAPHVSERLRSMSEAARQLGNGVLEDLRARRRRSPR